MDIKKLFGKTSLKTVSTVNNEVEENLESVDYLLEKSEDNNRVELDIDYSLFNNFVVYGSAQKYVKDSFENVYQNYPYDGSRKEKQQWINNLSLYDKYVFENLYPRSKGYINLNSGSGQYVFFKGGPQAGTVFDPTKNRNSNLQLSGGLGNTVEFWLKTHSSSIGSVLTVTGSTDRLLINVSSSNQFYVEYLSGSTGLTGSFSTLTASNNWNHYAFSFIQSGAYVTCESYLNGDYHSTISASATLQDFSNGGLKGYIGATSSSSGISNFLSCSIDEFRFWKEKRTEKDIATNYLYSVYGGANTDDANTNLGVYYKFNEGIINSSSTDINDKFIRDYSGRISNGTIVNYDYTCRSTGSAITYEENEPLLQYYNSYISDYSLPTDLQNTLDLYTQLAVTHDEQTNTNIINTIPSWILDEAEQKNKPALENLVQIIAREFDNLNLYISQVNKLKDVDYVRGDNKPLPFNKKLLTSNGLDVIDLFQESTLIEEVLNKNDNINFSKSLQNIKNVIYKNIYNNLSTIYKSKGTEKSFRNILRSVGIDNEIVKINLYPNNDIIKFDSTYETVDVKKKHLDFSKHNSASLYIDKNSPISPISLNAIQYTFECSVLFDDIQKYYEINEITQSQFVTSSLFGMRSTAFDSNSNFSVYSIKPDLNSKSAYFMLTSSAFSGLQLTSSEYFDVYADSKWTFAVRVKDSKSEYNDILTDVESDYYLEFHGVNTVGDSIVNQFTVSSSITTGDMTTWLGADKLLYVGCERQELSGSVINKSDAKVGSLRMYIDYLDNDTIYSHAVSPNNISVNKSLKGLYNRGIVSIKSLVVDMHFDQISSSNTSGEITGSDYADSYYVDYNYADLSNITSNTKTFYGIGFTPSSTNVVSNEIVSAVQQKTPESYSSDRLINVLDLDDEINSNQTSIINHTLLIEKSMYQSISDEMLNMLNSAYEMNNLIGNVFNKYEDTYKDLEVLKRIFFEKVNNVPDLERYLEFYKWIDSSIFHLLEQLIPASASYSKGIKNLIESHIFERNKLDYKPNFFAIKKTKQLNASATRENRSYLTIANHSVREPTNISELDISRQSITKAIRRRRFDKIPISYTTYTTE